MTTQGTIKLIFSAMVLCGTCAAQEVSTIQLDTTINADGMAFEADGKLLITSAYDGSTIARVDVTNGSVTTAVSVLNGPIDAAVDDAGNIYSSNWTGSSITRSTAAGVKTKWVNVEVGGDGLDFDDNGDLWWTNGVERLIRKITPGGTVSLVASGGLLSYPLSIVLADDGNFYVSEGNTGEIHRVGRDGTVTLFAQVPGSGQWKLGQITAANNKLYAAGQLTHRIFEIDMAGNVTVLAGSGKSINSDGVGEEASFNNPLGAVVSNDGSKLYVISGTPGTRALRVIQLRENDFAVDVGITGSWYDPTHDGEGFNIEILEDGVPLLFWYSYDESGNQRWFVGVGVISGNQLVFDELIETSGGMFGPDFDPADVESAVVGSATFSFADCESGQMSYVIDGLSGSMNLTRLTRIDGLDCGDSM